MTEPATHPSISQNALSGDLATLQQRWASADLNGQSAAFQLGCGQPNEAVPLWILSQLSSGQMHRRQWEWGLIAAAGRGHLATLKIAQAQQPWTTAEWIEITVRAMLTDQEACVAWLAPRGPAADLFEDVMDNYDDAYKLSYNQAMAVLDRAGPHLAKADQRAWLDEVGRTSGLLPRTLDAERSLNRQAELAARPATASGRPRLRP